MGWMIAGFYKKSKVLGWIGLYSLYFYVWQFKVTDFMKNIAEIVCGRIQISSPEVMVGVAFVLSLVVLVPLVILSDKYIPFMFGKKAKHHEENHGAAPDATAPGTADGRG